MNKLQTNGNGGHPIDLDDLRWQDDAIREAIGGAMALWGIDTYANSFIIQGCVISGGPFTFTISAGYICLKGEVLRVDAHTLPAIGIGDVRYWEVETTYDSTGSETFQNGALVDTYEIRRGKIVAGPAPVDYLPAAATRLEEKIYTKLDALSLFAHKAQEAWHEVGGAGEPAFQGGYANYPSNGGPLEFRKDEFGNVNIRGCVSSANLFGSGLTIFTLPSGYQPPYNINIPVTTYEIASGNKDVLLLDIITNGRLRPKDQIGAAFTTDHYIIMDLSFRV